MQYSVGNRVSKYIEACKTAMNDPLKTDIKANFFNGQLRAELFINGVYAFDTIVARKDSNAFNLPAFFELRLNQVKPDSYWPDCDLVLWSRTITKDDLTNMRKASKRDYFQHNLAVKIYEFDIDEVICFNFYEREIAAFRWTCSYDIHWTNVEEKIANLNRILKTLGATIFFIRQLNSEIEVRNFQLMSKIAKLNECNDKLNALVGTLPHVINYNQ
jgi:hypothetical protein